MFTGDDRIKADVDEFELFKSTARVASNSLSLKKPSSAPLCDLCSGSLGFGFPLCEKSEQLKHVGLSGNQATF